MHLLNAHALPREVTEDGRRPPQVNGATTWLCCL